MALKISEMHTGGTALGADIASAKAALDSLLALEPALHETAQLLVDTLARGNTILVCGNGGSAAEGQHFVTELVGRYRTNRRPLPAVFLGGDTGQMSCIANDFSWDEVFARPLRAFARPGDVLLCFSSSGQSSNIVAALKAAREIGITSVALLGKTGGPAAPLADRALVVRSDSTARAQECHLFLLHWLCEHLEKLMPAEAA